MTSPVLTNTYSREGIKGYPALEELALNIFSSWNHSADKVWKELDAQLWELTKNPWVVLQTVSKEKLERTLENPSFKALIDDLVQTRRRVDESPTWFQENYPRSPLSCVAYFSMEYMLSEALPIYSGGLGNVAGDQLKAAGDLGIPVAAVGLLYQRGYFRQIIDKNGAQQAFYPFNDPGQLPIMPLRKPNGEWVRIEIALPGWSVWLRAWQVQVGRAKLYLLDSNDAANYPPHRGITSELYGGNAELRLKQELVLGIGGWRLLKELGLKPEVCHLNEGHAAFAVLERAKSFMEQSGLPFEAALEVTRAGNLFTTHTAVPAGFDRFEPSLITQYLGSYALNQLHIAPHELLALGRGNPEDQGEYFNMAYLAVRGSGSINGVSRLHGKVSREIFAPLFPRWPEDDVPVGYVTNGVHMPSWDSAHSDALWEDACGRCRWLGRTEELEKQIRKIPDFKIWQMRNEGRRSLVQFARKRLSRMLAARGASLEETESALHLLDPNTLTLGFARRFATYKRPNLLLHDPGRLLRLFKNSKYPVQLLIAGKAHPADHPGQALIQEWLKFIKSPEARPHIIFLSDYDMNLTENLVQGVDVWINTPRRPWEACGTSGMKVLVNGGINVSELDGWWAEAYTPEVGWALGDGKEHGEDPAWDAAEADALYDLLEKELVPEFYDRDDEGIPTKWIARIRESMARLTPLYSANRAVLEYTEKHYFPGASAYLKRAAENGAEGQRIVDWQKNLKLKWNAIRFVDVKIMEGEDKHDFEAKVYLDEIDPAGISCELYADNSEGPEKHKMEQVRQLAGEPGTYVFRAIVPASRPAKDYTPRIIPSYPGASVPLESSQILWQK